MLKDNSKFKAFLFTIGICAAVAGLALIISGNRMGVFGFLSGVFVAYFGFKKNNQPY
ncbi:MAG: hypothetical protein ABJN95_01610 [Maribacter sp.]|uniref:hypothetical protein n=1 Tax=Maribacter sp. TaxID=1897614 RepID=UPI0032989475